MKPKFIIKLEGGLGNQLFQYAHAVALQKAYGGVIVLDKHAFNKKQARACALENYALNEHTRTEMSKKERVAMYIYFSLNRIVRRWNLVVTDRAYRRLSKTGLYYQYKIRWFDSILKPSMCVNYVTGNWFSENFFKNAEKEVRNAYRYTQTLPERCSDLISEIVSTESVCVHIRLGDYLLPQWKDKLFVCTPEYYRQAMELLKMKVENPRFFIFSNRHKDFEMIQRDYDLGDVTYVDMGNTDVEDMELMRNCKHFIMSNSTYSWWGQYLADNPNKVVVAPSCFNKYPRWDMSDIYQDNWNIINV